VHDEHTCPDPSPQDLGLMAKRLAPDDFPRADSVGSRVKQRRTQGLSLKHNAVNNLLIKILLRHFRLVWYLPHPALPVLYVPHKFKTSVAQVSPVRPPGVSLDSLTSQHLRAKILRHLDDLHPDASGVYHIPDSPDLWNALVLSYHLTAHS
ncbi:hypothetical protein FOZ63_018255, partial [Perkinsus olseni]